MYLKIMSRDDDKTNTFIGVQRVEFFHIDAEEKRLTELLGYADLPLVSNLVLQLRENGGDGSVKVGVFNLWFKSGKTLYIIFDGVAFLCNETGKTVDRYLAN